MMANKIVIGILAIGLLAAAAVGCVPVYSAGKAGDLTEVVDLEEAQDVQVDIVMGAGELELRGGADALLEGYFRASDETLLPDVSYRVRSQHGSLQVEQEERPGNQVYSDFYNRWDLVFNSDVPLDLNLTMGAGEVSLDLDELNLRSFTMEMGAGEADLDFTQAPQQDLDVNIQGGVGQLTVRLPQGVNIEAHVTGGLGEVNARGLVQRNGVYVSEYQGSGPRMRFEIQAGIGELNLLVE